MSRLLEDAEIQSLTEEIFRRYGYDFRDYAAASLKRRIRSRVSAERLDTVTALQEKAMRDPACMERLLHHLSVSFTAMFRDPSFFLAVRTKVVPLLKTYPFLRIWHAGCSSGEEVYSLAILLQEEELYHRCRIYATDMNETVVRDAKEGIFRLAALKDYTANYLAAGGKSAFSEYYTAMYDSAIFRPALIKNVVFAQHNLATDGPFNEFHLILCRNVMIYFNRKLQAHVHTMLVESLVRLGFLGIGTKESLQFTNVQARYEEFDAAEKIYRKIT